MATQTARRLFTVDEYHRLVAAGILGEDDRVELLDGELIEMSPIGSRHAACVSRINRILVTRLGRGAVVAVQNPVALGRTSEPQPDLAILRPRDDFYADGHPGPKDVLFLVEVMDESRVYDRGPKLTAYARARIPEVWLVDLRDETIEVCREPALRAYRLRQTFGRGRRVSPGAFPSLRCRVDDIIG